MAVRLSTEKSKEVLKRLIRKEFDSINFAMDYIYNKADELIELAKYYGLNEFAKELEQDKKLG